MLLYPLSEMNLMLRTDPYPALVLDDHVHVVGEEKVLLFDDHYTHEKQGFQTTLHPPARDADPVLVADRPWERGGLIGDSNVTVMEDDGVYRMWYVVRDQRRTIALEPTSSDHPATEAQNDKYGDSRRFLCYAESTDGLRWTKPALNLIEFDGAMANNMILTGRMGGTVFKDPLAPPQQRYKFIHGHGPRLPHVYRDGSGPARYIFHGIYGSTSPDGIHWTVHPQPIMPWLTDSTAVAYWDDRLGKYVAYVRFNQNMDFQDNQTLVMERGGEHYRAIGRSESDDFFHFPKPTKIAEPSPDERRPRATGMDYYNTAAVKYGGGDSYLMFSSNFYHEQDVLQVHLATSRDGVNYQRWHEPLISPGLDGTWQGRSIYMATGMIRRGGEIWMYYRGRGRTHRERTVEPLSSGIGRVRFRRDGFVSQSVGSDGGRLLTRPIRCDGDRLELNMNAHANGRLKVELCDIAGQPLPGFAAEDADWLWYNDLARRVTWRGSDDITALRDRPIRLHIIAESTELFAFQFRRGASSSARSGAIDGGAEQQPHHAQPECRRMKGDGTTIAVMQP